MLYFAESTPCKKYCHTDFLRCVALIAGRFTDCHLRNIAFSKRIKKLLNNLFRCLRWVTRKSFVWVIHILVINILAIFNPPPPFVTNRHHALTSLPQIWHHQKCWFLYRDSSTWNSIIGWLTLSSRTIWTKCADKQEEQNIVNVCHMSPHGVSVHSWMLPFIFTAALVADCCCWTLSRSVRLNVVIHQATLLSLRLGDL